VRASGTERGSSVSTANDLLEKAAQYSRLSAECSDPTSAKALRIVAEYLIEKAREKAARPPIE
jgi:hypothetical protein